MYGLEKPNEWLETALNQDLSSWYCIRINGHTTLHFKHMGTILFCHCKAIYKLFT